MTTLTTLGVLAQAAGQVGSGRIQGGWEYVWACYGSTAVVLVLYSLSLWLRRPQAPHDAKE